MEKQVVHSFKRNENEEVKISVGNYKDRDYVDIRVFFFDAATGEPKPTKKGVTLNCALVGELIEGLRRAEQAVHINQ